MVFFVNKSIIPHSVLKCGNISLGFDYGCSIVYSSEKVVRKRIDFGLAIRATHFV